MSGRVVDMDRLIAEAEMLLASGERKFLAMAGAPGSGKSTTAESLFEQLASRHPGKVAILPMDGFHYDDALLHEMGRRPWKGAPDTFDVGGLRSILHRLASGEEQNVAVPVFDRELEISRGSARLISDEARLIIVEGNYILLDEAPWDRLADCFDLTVMIDVPEAELRRRLRVRWEGYGLSEAEIDHKLDGNDLPNGRVVIQKSRPAELVYRSI
ncbi:nucleoside/nucleotide kinase family protein [Rhizobium sp. L1K21]|uniref:nucleoside/nucleotide kinase family protein n=1 Tax=Rhizobium sp. L1K21 TaxID=2954933 RepID=UPI0020931268|nr:nucleoside/nucleotide kinase family protein [Rhizobium sp. L1K21]MCO6184704.1 nucleoside/nucleotide kinase family protein [Rhizobium sp. L1K21]